MEEKIDALQQLEELREIREKEREELRRVKLESDIDQVVQGLYDNYII